MGCTRGFGLEVSSLRSSGHGQQDGGTRGDRRQGQALGDGRHGRFRADLPEAAEEAAVPTWSGSGDALDVHHSDTPKRSQWSRHRLRHCFARRFHQGLLAAQAAAEVGHRGSADLAVQGRIRGILPQHRHRSFGDTRRGALVPRSSGVCSTNCKTHDEETTRARQRDVTRDGRTPRGGSRKQPREGERFLADAVGVRPFPRGQRQPHRERHGRAEARRLLETSAVAARS